MVSLCFSFTIFWHWYILKYSIPRHSSQCLPKAKVFHIQQAIQSVIRLNFFHMLKTRWKMFKNQVCTPTFRVEFHSFHRVFNFSGSTRKLSAVLFVKFKSELWQFFEGRSSGFCQNLQHQNAQCEFVLKTPREPPWFYPVIGVYLSLIHISEPTRP